MFSHAVPINFAAFQQYALEYGVLYKRYFCRLWLLTVNKLCETGSTPYTENELMKDPLTVLRCDRRILRYYRRIRNIFFYQWIICCLYVKCLVYPSLYFTGKFFFKFVSFFSRCAPIFTIITRVLMGYLAASRAMLNQHILANSSGAKSNASTSFSNVEQEREELKSALIAAQESAVVQILLEVCLLTPEEKEVKFSRFLNICI